MSIATPAPGHLAPADRELLRRLWAQSPHATLKDVRAAFRRATGRRVGTSAAHRHRPPGLGRRHATRATLAALGLRGRMLEAVWHAIRAATAIEGGPMRNRHLRVATTLIVEELRASGILDHGYVGRPGLPTQ